MKRATLLLVLLAAGCRHAAPPAAAPLPATTPPPMPFAAVLWKAEKPAEDDRALRLDEKEGILKRPELKEEGRTWPFAIDYWGIARTDVDALLSPYVGRRIRVRGIYKKIDVHGQWRYEVEPETITLLPDASATPAH